MDDDGGEGKYVV